jgi:hypothetical protein
MRRFGQVLSACAAIMLAVHALASNVLASTPPTEAPQRPSEPSSGARSMVASAC